MRSRTCLGWLRILCLSFVTGPWRQVVGSGDPTDLFNPLKTQSFERVGLHAKEDMALADLTGRVGALGDFDSDLHTDLFWISENSSTISVVRWNPRKAEFELPLLTSVSVPVDAADTIVNIAPCDFNLDGKLDVLVVLHHADGTLSLLLFFGDTKHLNPRPLRLPQGMGVQPIVVEGNGDLWPDLFGEARTDSGNAAPIRRNRDRASGYWHEQNEADADVQSRGRGGETRQRFHAQEREERRSGEGEVRRVFWINRLREAPASCWNQILDEGEDDVDCGGSCLACACFTDVNQRRHHHHHHQQQQQNQRGSDEIAEGEQVGRRRAEEGGVQDCGFDMLSVMEKRARLAARAHSFADMDGDGLADLVLHTVDDTVEVWVNMGGDGTVPSFMPPAPDRLVLTLPEGAGSVAVTDFNRDGRVDLLYASTGSCARGRFEAGLEPEGVSPCQVSEIWIAYNTGQEGSYCRQDKTVSIGSGKRGKPTERVGEKLMETSDFKGASLFGAGEVVGGGAGLADGWSLSRELGMDPLLLRTGDIDLDGFVDVIVPVRGRSGLSQVAVLWNVADSAMQARTLELRDCEKGCPLEALNGITGAYGAGLIDLGERGAQDMLILYADLEGGLRVSALWSNLRDGNLFLKARGLNGVCPEWCPGLVPFPDPKPYGVNAPGVSFRYTMLDLSSSRLTMQATQLARSSMAALDAPSIIFGLGDAYYYIEELFVGVTAVSEEGEGQGKGACRSWKGLIPNSQIVVSPTGGADGEWYLAVLVHASNGVLYVTAVLAVTLLVLSVSIWLLKRREKFLDAMEKQLTAHAFL